jgi:hypothetical protein
MSEISQKSISGITSITTPAGIDNQFTLHTNDTSQAAKLDAAGNFHFNNHVNTTGITSASNFKTGSSNLHSTGLTVGDTFVHSTGVNASSMDIDDFVDVGNNIKLGNAGVITATSFVGDGSDLTNLPAGLGTALSATASSPLNKMYYTNQVLGVPSSVTVDVPASASKAYTQYADIKVESSADLIIAEGDDLIPDVLGLADFGTFGGGATAGRIRVNSISNAANDGSPTVQKGLVVTGVCTATSFSGDGSNLTGISGVSVANQADNRLITATGTTDALNGESTLTYDGTTFKVGPGGVPGTGGALAVRGSANSTQASFSDNTSGTFRIATASGALNLLLVESGQSFVFGIGNNSGLSSEHLRIDSSGRLLIGTDLTDNRDGFNSALQIGGTGGDDSSMCIGRYSANVSSPNLVLSKSRSATINAHTRVNTGDYLGGIQFQGDDGTRFLVGANIVAQAASPVADYDMATDLIISTNSGTTSPNKSMTLDHQGRFTTPNQPFVFVHINTTTNRNATGSQMVIPWDTIHARSTNSNMGSHFNTSNHRFTAPVDGRYLFVCSLNIVGDNIMYHRINGSNVHGGEYRMTQLVWDHIDSSFIYDMNANDYYDMTSQLYDGSGQRWNSGGTGTFGWDGLSIYLLG